MSSGPTPALAGATRARSRTAPGDRRAGERAGRPLRIGELAELTGTTPRTIRYYEEIGLLDRAGEREQGKHRCYAESDVERLREVLRLRDLLGLSLDELSQLLEAEDARAELRREYAEAEAPAQRLRLLRRSLEHLDSQRELVRGRIAELEQLAGELEERRGLILRRIQENS